MPNLNISPIRKAIEQYYIPNLDIPLNWRVEKMKRSRDKTQIAYNNFLTIDGIPPQVFDYRTDDPQYIVKLIGKVITVSLETVDIVDNLPAL